MTEGTPGDVVRAAAYAKAQSMVGEDDWVEDLVLGTGYPVGGEDGDQVEWPFTFQVVPPGGSAVGSR
ncbi:hypothetical protein [Mycolicibacterium brisbanense]